MSYRRLTQYSLALRVPNTVGNTSREISYKTPWQKPINPHPGHCITNVFATRRKNFSQWHRSFQRKLLSHWLKFLRHVAITLVIQGPGLDHLNHTPNHQRRSLIWIVYHIYALVWILAPEQPLPIFWSNSKDIAIVIISWLILWESINKRIWIDRISNKNIVSVRATRGVDGRLIKTVLTF